MPWTLFWDMHSGGRQKLEWDKIYIEAEEEIACRVFAAKFSRQADHVTCPCCGEDYSVRESPSLEEATEYHRGATPNSWRKFISLEDYVTDPSVKIVYKQEILPEEEVHPLVRQVVQDEYY
jgi:hypothetical protein